MGDISIFTPRIGQVYTLGGFLRRVKLSRARARAIRKLTDSVETNNTTSHDIIIFISVRMTCGFRPVRKKKKTNLIAVIALRFGRTVTPRDVTHYIYVSLSRQNTCRTTP